VDALLSEPAICEWLRRRVEAEISERMKAQDLDDVSDEKC
jgi:hypothetical protein